MVSLRDVRAHNTSLKSLSPGLVAIFVGGTSGISHFTAREFARNTVSPIIYLVGRNEIEAAKITKELKSINSSSQISFIQRDVSLLRGVDEVCAEIKEKEKKVNLLFMTIGTMTFKGRDETKEGLDRKFALHYYSRMRFIQQLMPLLKVAAEDQDPKANLSRVVSVFDPLSFKKNALNFLDLSLKDNFSLRNCATHASVMGNFTLEHFAKAYPQTSFIHAYPSAVETGISRDAFGKLAGPMHKGLSLVLKPFFVPQKESGERHLYASTAPRYVSKSKAEAADAAMGADEVRGSGHYHLNWDGETRGDTKQSKALRDEGAEQRIWTHAEEVFKKICDGGEKC